MASSAESTDSEEVTKLMGLGKRHLLCNEVVQAVKCFEEATQALDGKHGSGSDECGEAYLFYGKALLELARAENGVLGNALKDVEPKSDESSDEDEEKMEAVGPKIREMSPSAKEKIRDDVHDAMAEKEEGTQATEKKDNNKEQKDGTNDDNSDEVPSKTDREGKDEIKEGQSEELPPKEAADEEMKDDNSNDENKKDNEKDGEGEVDDEGEDGNEANEEEAEQDDENADDGDGDAAADTAEGQEEDADVPTMQLAWEFLELARLVFARHDDRESQLNLAQVHLKLGEIQVEQEQFVDAERDFLKCLELQEKNLEPDDRLVAETAYNLGLAYSLQPNYTKAKEFYSKALAVIELRTSKLEARLAESKDKGKGKATDDDPFVVDRKELGELQNLYPDIKARVDDAQEMINSTANQPPSTTEEGFGSSKQGSSDELVNTIAVKKAPTVQSVNDVSHLVRRKRKPEEESSGAVSEDSQVPLKKARQDEEQQASTVPNENGHAQS